MDKVQLSLVDEGIDTDVQEDLRITADWETKDCSQYFWVDSLDHIQLSSSDVP